MNVLFKQIKLIDLPWGFGGAGLIGGAGLFSGALEDSLGAFKLLLFFSGVPDIFSSWDTFHKMGRVNV